MLLNGSLRHQSLRIQKMNGNDKFAIQINNLKKYKIELEIKIIHTAQHIKYNASSIFDMPNRRDYHTFFQSKVELNNLKQELKMVDFWIRGFEFEQEHSLTHLQEYASIKFENRLDQIINKDWE